MNTQEIGSAAVTIFALSQLVKQAGYDPSVPHRRTPARPFSAPTAPPPTAAYDPSVPHHRTPARPFSAPAAPAVAKAAPVAPTPAPVAKSTEGFTSPAAPAAPSQASAETQDPMPQTATPVAVSIPNGNHPTPGMTTTPGEDKMGAGYGIGGAATPAPAPATPAPATPAPAEGGDPNFPLAPVAANNPARVPVMSDSFYGKSPTAAPMGGFNRSLMSSDNMRRFQRSTGSRFNANSAMDQANLMRMLHGTGSLSNRTMNTAQYRAQAPQNGMLAGR